MVRVSTESEVAVSDLIEDLGGRSSASARIRYLPTVELTENEHRNRDQELSVREVIHRKGTCTARPQATPSTAAETSSGNHVTAARSDRHPTGTETGAASPAAGVQAPAMTGRHQPA